MLKVKGKVMGSCVAYLEKGAILPMETVWSWRLTLGKPWEMGDWRAERAKVNLQGAYPGFTSMEGPSYLYHRHISIICDNNTPKHTDTSVIDIKASVLIYLCSAWEESVYKRHIHRAHWVLDSRMSWKVEIKTFKIETNTEIVSYSWGSVVSGIKTLKIFR